MHMTRLLSFCDLTVQLCWALDCFVCGPVRWAERFNEPKASFANIIIIVDEPLN